MPGTVGARIRELRQRRGLSQSELAQSLPVSASYISLIETNRRHPRQPTLSRLADRLGCSAHYLLTGSGGPDCANLELELRFAELALRNGDHEAARERYQAVWDEAGKLGYDEVERDARWGLGQVQLAIGDLESAIETMEALAAESSRHAPVSRTTLAAVLAHAYTECGEPTRAIEVAEAALADDDSGPHDDERIRLAATLVLAYYNRGDLMRAHLLVRQLVDDAEASQSPKAKAAAYWNAGLVAEARGDVRAARLYTERALALYDQLDNERATGILRLNCAWIMLRSPDPDIPAATTLLRHARQQLCTVGTEVDVALVETELARCRLLAGDPAAAVAGARTALCRLGPGQRLESARGTVLLARALAATGDTAAAHRAYAAAAQGLAGVEVCREAAPVWRELAEGLEALGATPEALAAYRGAVDAALVGQVLPVTSATAVGLRRQ